jgi:hypothetical protein
VLWEYTEPVVYDGGGNVIEVPFAPWHASWLPNGNVLIASRHQGRVLEVDFATKAIEWEYGSGPTLTPAPNAFFAAFHVVRNPATNRTLICDSQYDRVIEVRTEDYDPALPANGYTESSFIVHSMPAGTWPRFVQVLPSGNMLVAGAGAAIFELDPSWNRVWQLPSALLGRPGSAVQLADGDILVSEEEATQYPNGRAYRITRDGTMVWEYSISNTLGLDGLPLNDARRAIEGLNGSTLIADQRNGRVIELGRAVAGSGTSAATDCGLPGVRKLFTSVAADLDVPAGTTAQVEYAVDGGAWQSASGSALPAGTYGKLIAYRVSFATDRYDRTPRLLGVQIGYEPAPENATTNGAGSGSGTPARSRASGSTAGTGTGAGNPGDDAAMSSLGGYTTGVALAEAADGSVDLRRGWSMAQVAPLDGRSAAGGSAPAPSPTALGALGVIYLAGVLAAPIADMTGSIWRRLRPVGA